jgi:hypothetical protein
MAAADAAVGLLLVPLNKLWGRVSILLPGVYFSLEKNGLADQSASSQLGAVVVISQARWRARVRPV